MVGCNGVTHQAGAEIGAISGGQVEVGNFGGGAGDLVGVAALEQHLVSISDSRYVNDPLCKHILEREGFTSAFAYPMLAKGKVRGVL